MDQICEITTDNYKMRIYEGEIVEIEYTTDRIDFFNASFLYNSIRYQIEKLFTTDKKRFVLVLNFKNVTYTDSAAIGTLINTKTEMSRYNRKDTIPYAINLNKNILKVYKTLGLDHKILMIGMDCIDDIYEIEKFKMENKDIIIDNAADKMIRIVSNYNEIEEIKKQKISDDNDRKYLQNNIDNTINELIAIGD